MKRKKKREEGEVFIFLFLSVFSPNMLEPLSQLTSTSGVISRLMWVRVRKSRECWAFVSIYGLGCERSEEERDEFWNELTRCVDGLSTRNYVVVLGDFSARVGDGEVEGIIGKYGVPGENESGERLLDMCVEQELVIVNSFLKKKGINKCTWIRVANGRVI